ncbi:T9SS type A sorting domain-containing protein [Polaribacter pectinis]|uniref:T9SS type A sorting domain-containing protein n=1 Tax=Polaribacter pectinis TaxID=2738844 RepID=A0A7G9L7V1_9FLAO|nr:LamG-like jellyroll fold domain-containing protein [Polaribacter pectinis]QNM84700.1 T9SS type A sorting domain-containing protein [Polaribacter pectinis]
MKNIKNHFPIILIFISHFVFSQIPCSSGFTANGTNDFIEVPSTTFINSNNTAVANRSFEFWFKTSDITTKQLIYEEGGGVNAFTIHIEAGRIYSGQYIDNAASAPVRLYFRSGAGEISVDKWHHFAYTLNSGSTAKWYLDGVEQDSQTAFAVKKHTGDINFARSGGNMKYPSSLVSDWNASSIGSSTSENYTAGFTGNITSPFYFSGDISLFRIWNVARTQTEIDTNKSTYLTSGTSLVAYQDGEEINYQATGAAAPTSVQASDNSGTTYTWTGGTSSDFTNDANFTGTSLDATKIQTVVINSGSFDPILSSETKIGRLTVDSGVEIIVQSGATLNIFYELTNNGTITVEDGGSLVYHSCSTAIIGSGTFNIKRTTPTYSGSDYYSYWSSPVISSESNIATVFSEAELIYRFDAASSNSDWVFHGKADFNTGIGYAVQNEGFGGQSRDFTGTINQGKIVVTVYDTSNLTGTDNDGNAWSTSGDNLVGNPYSSAIDWGLVVTDSDNEDINGTIYLWAQNSAEIGENNVNDYVSYNGTGGSTAGIDGKIASGQGFFVKTEAGATTSITFKPTHQISGSNTQFFRSSNSSNENKKGRSWFTFNHNNKTNTLLVGFVEGATNRFDRLYDAPFDVNQTSMGFYSLVKGVDKAQIQGLPVLKRSKKVVKLGYVVDEIGDYSIGIQDEYIDNDYYIYLRDTEKKITVDLRQREYQFNIDTIGENNTRFKIIYTKKKRNSAKKSEGKESLTVEEIDSKDFTIYVDSSKELIAEYDFDVDNVKEVSMYNIQGRKITSFLGEQVKNVSNLKTGIYLVNATLHDGRTLTKKILIAN